MVEDEYLIALELGRRLTAAGVTVVGPVAKLEDGLALAQTARLDGALLDVNLGVAMSFPIADCLAARSIPYALLTGHDVLTLPRPYSAMPHLNKPVAYPQLLERLEHLMEPPPLSLPGRDTAPAHRRMAALADLDDTAHEALAQAIRRARPMRPRREMIHEGRPVSEPLLVARGWAARVRHLEDGRRQIMSFMLPGDLIDECRQTEPLAVSSVIALKDVAVSPAPSPNVSPTLAEAYAMSHALEEAYLLAQITRLGRLSAEERLADLFLELFERLGLCGLVIGASYQMPLTQEVLADATGLSSVHLNRTLQLLRRQGDITFQSGLLRITDPVRLAKRVGRVEVRISRRAARGDSTQARAAGNPQSLI